MDLYGTLVEAIPYCEFEIKTEGDKQVNEYFRNQAALSEMRRQPVSAQRLSRVVPAVPPMFLYSLPGRGTQGQR